jgi:hypothetical protein
MGNDGSVNTSPTRRDAEMPSRENKGGPGAIGKAAGSSDKAENASDAITSTAAAPSNNTKSKAKAKVDWEWVTYCAPSWTQDEDSEEEENTDEKEGRGDRETSCGRPDCKCGKPLSQNPSWPWFISKRGFAVTMKWQSERLKRCQDEYGVYFYNDYSGYGMMECVDNILLALDKELSKKRVHNAALWALVEGMGLFFGFRG